MNISTTLETNSKATEMMEPVMRAVNDPAIPAEAAAMFGTALRDHRPDTTIPQRVDTARSRNHDRRKDMTEYGAEHLAGSARDIGTQSAT